MKGKGSGATTVTISKTQILTALNKPDDFVLAIVKVEDGAAKKPLYIKRPFSREPDFAVTSVNFDLQEMLAKAEPQYHVCEITSSASPGFDTQGA